LISLEEEAMGDEMMDLEGLARYIHRDMREVGKMASRGYLPGHKVAGEWRFARAEIHLWIEKQLHAYSEQELAALESRGSQDTSGEVLISSLLPAACIAVPFAASTRASCLKELVRLAERSWHVYDAEAIHAAIQQREEMGTTALESGVAIPHPRRSLPAALAESVIAYGRSASGVPFGAPHGVLTDIFFLVCCRDDQAHLRVLARLSRLLLRPGFLEELRGADTPADTLQVIEAEERDLVVA
jgi:PTS system nitrogen regulatory IIA component